MGAMILIDRFAAPANRPPSLSERVCDPQVKRSERSLKIIANIRMT